MEATKVFGNYPTMGEAQKKAIIASLQKEVGANYEFYKSEHYAYRGSNFLKFIFKHKNAKEFAFNVQGYELKIIAFTEKEAKQSPLYQIHNEFEL